LNLTAALHARPELGPIDFGTVLAEARHYRQPVRRVVLAMRVMTQGSFGPDAQNVYLGGPTRLHVPDFHAMSGQRAASANFEARFPLLRGLTLAVPTPWTLPTVNGAIFADGARAWTPFGRQQLGVLGWSVYLGAASCPRCAGTGAGRARTSSTSTAPSRCITSRSPTTSDVRRRRAPAPGRTRAPARLTGCPGRAGPPSIVQAAAALQQPAIGADAHDRVLAAHGDPRVAARAST